MFDWVLSAYRCIHRRVRVSEFHAPGMGPAVTPPDQTDHRFSESVSRAWVWVYRV
jgi:hypothetical protein